MPQPMQWLIDIIQEWLQLYLTGMIVIWSGTLDNIPDGWVLCDGNNGTPDLRERFVPGARDTLPPGNTGGVRTHFHTMFDTHTHTHNHPSVDTGLPSAFVNRTVDGVPSSSTFHKHAVDLPEIESSAVAGGRTDVVLNLPPYYALAYIMKT